MNVQNPFTNASQIWIDAVKQKRTISKKAKQSVIAFAMWLDQMTEGKERKEREEN